LSAAITPEPSTPPTRFSGAWFRRNVEASSPSRRSAFSLATFE